MSITSLLRKAAGSPEDRRKSPRKSCRLSCTIHRKRKRIPARVLDVSEGGLCLLSPVALQAKERVVLHIDVPPHGPSEVEAIAWHVRRVKSGNSRRKSWSVGMMITQADGSFQKLFDSQRHTDAEAQPADSKASEFLEELTLDSEKLSPEWDQWSSDWDQLFEQSERLLDASEEVLSQADLQVFRVRIKATAGPRTRTLTLNANSGEEAAASAAADLGDAWKILEVTRA